MAIKLTWIHLLVITFFIGVNGEGQFAVLHAPRSVIFVGGEGIQDDALKDIYLIALGFTTGMQTSPWSEIKIVNPFDTPEAAVAIYVEGVSSIGTFTLKNLSDISLKDEDSKIYPLQLGKNDKTFDMVEKRFSKLGEPKCKLVNIKLSSEYDLRMYSHIFGEYTNYKLPKLPLIHLMYTLEEDYRFLRELQALNAITVSVKSGILKPDGAKDFYLLRFRSLEALTKHYGEDSDATIEAKRLLNQQIRQLNKAFMTAYDGNILFTVVMTDITIQRERRHAIYHNNRIGGSWRSNKELKQEAEEEGKEEEQGMENKEEVDDIEEEDQKPPEDSSQKPLTPGGKLNKKPQNDIAMINIIFWLCISLFYSMIAVAYVMISLDPGRDSIVYRMTSQIDRIKME